MTVCAEPGCGNTPHARGFCKSCYNKKLYRGELEVLRPTKRTRERRPVELVRSANTTDDEVVRPELPRPTLQPPGWHTIRPANSHDQDQWPESVTVTPEMLRVFVELLITSPTSIQRARDLESAARAYHGRIRNIGREAREH